MKFQIDLKYPEYSEKLNYNHKILCIGSCFTENIGNKLASRYFNTIINPNGIVYNPLSLFKQLESYSKKNENTEIDAFFFNELWLSWAHHSSFSHPNKIIFEQQIIESQNKASEQIRNADFILITLGSAFAYHLKSNHNLVANCHKYPNTHFTKKLLTVDSILSAFDTLYNQLKINTPKTQIIFTISPVRHIKDGVIENNRSKAVLHLIVNEIINKYSGTHYFPAYEIIIDQLRDYRFYDTDLVHPNKIGIDYVWEAFKTHVLGSETKKYINAIDVYQKMEDHRPLHSETSNYQKFKKQKNNQLEFLKKQYPFLNNISKFTHL